MVSTTINLDSTSKPLLELKDFSVSVPGRALFRNLNLTIKRGDIICFSSPSGSGKSTLLRSIALLIDPAGGQCLLNGKPPEDIGIPHYRRKVVYVDQTPVFLPGTVESNLERSFSYHSAQKSFSLELAENLIERTMLPKSILKQRVDTLSIGEQQRVSLVRALLLSPTAYLFDEPTSALDEDSAMAVESLISGEVKRKNSIALVVTHKNERIDRFCSQRINLMQYASNDSPSSTDKRGD